MRNSMARRIIFIVTVAVFLFSTTMVIKHQVEMRIGAKQAEAIIQMVVSPVSIQDETAGQIISAPTLKQSESEKTEKPNDEPTAFAPIQVDFDALFTKNQDVVAWLYCPDTPINYPVVQSSDNNYYLRRLLDGSYNSAGTLFLDYRNAEDLSNWNSVIYGHNMKNDSMFGTLPDYKTPSYFQEHPEMFLLTPEQDYSIQLLAGFTTPASSELYSSFAPDAAEDHLITLSTCSYEYDNARYVLIGILKECRSQE